MNIQELFTVNLNHPVLGQDCSAILLLLDERSRQVEITLFADSDHDASSVVKTLQLRRSMDYFRAPVIGLDRSIDQLMATQQRINLFHVEGEHGLLAIWLDNEMGLAAAMLHSKLTPS